MRLKPKPERPKGLADVNVSEKNMIDRYYCITCILSLETLEKPFEKFIFVLL